MTKQKVPQKRRPGRGFDEISIGEKDTARFDVSEEWVAFLSTLDGQPLHSNEEYAKETIFGGRVAHGALIAVFLSAVCGERLPGNGWVISSLTTYFYSPVRVGEVVEVCVAVKEKEPNKNRLKQKIRCSFVCRTVLAPTGKTKGGIPIMNLKKQVVMRGAATLIDGDALNR